MRDDPDPDEQLRRMQELQATDQGLADHPAAAIETVVVDPDDVVEAFRRNATEEHPLRSHVLRLSPPFDTEEHAELHVQEGPKRYPPEGPEPLHLEPATFVENDDGVHPNETHLEPPTLAAVRERVEETDEGETDAVEAAYDEQFATFERDVRASLLERVRIYFHGSSDEIWTDVRYEPREE